MRSCRPELHPRRRSLRGALGIAWLLLAFPCGGPLKAQTTASTLPAHDPFPLTPQYQALQKRLAKGWNTWDVNSVATEVLLPQGLAIHFGLKHNTTEGGDALLSDILIGRLTPDAEQVVPGPHAWDGSYTDLHITWNGHVFRLETAHDGSDVVMLATPLPSPSKEALPPTALFTVNFLWNRPGTTLRQAGSIQAHSSAGTLQIYCTCEPASGPSPANHAGMTISPLTGPFFAADLIHPVAISSGQPRSLGAVQHILDRERAAYQKSLGPAQTEKDTRTSTAQITDAIETTLGWDTIYEPEKQRVVSPVSRVWSVRWGGYVIFDWDTFFAATMAAIGDRDLAYADAIETLREVTPQGFVPNYARAGNWKSFDRSEPPVGSLTVLGLYQRFGDRWLLQQAFPVLLSWNRWWNKHRSLDGYLTWGSDGDNPPGNLDDNSRGTREGAILESGLDNSPMYDDASFDPHTHLLRFADVGLLSMYIADCDALATIATTLGNTVAAQELHARADHYRAALKTLWSPSAGIFLNKNLATGQFETRLSPTNFYPMLAHAATPQQARTMVEKHMLNPDEFWGPYVLPSIARNDPAFKDQNYWRGRIWGPMNYLVYLGLRNYNLPESRQQLAAKSYELFLKEWQGHGHVHENYNALLGTGDDVTNSDRFYHWGALLGFTEYLEQTSPPPALP